MVGGQNVAGSRNVGWGIVETAGCRNGWVAELHCGKLGRVSWDLADPGECSSAGAAAVVDGVDAGLPH